MCTFKMTHMDRIKKTITMSKKIDTKLRIQAAIRHKTMSELIEDALRVFFDLDEK